MLDGIKIAMKGYPSFYHTPDGEKIDVSGFNTHEDWANKMFNQKNPPSDQKQIREKYKHYIDEAKEEKTIVHDAFLIKRGWIRQLGFNFDVYGLQNNIGRLQEIINDFYYTSGIRDIKDEYVRIHDVSNGSNRTLSLSDVMEMGLGRALRAFGFSTFGHKGVGIAPHLHHQDDSAPLLRSALRNGYTQARWILNPDHDWEQENQVCPTLDGQVFEIEELLAGTNFDAPIFEKSHVGCKCSLELFNPENPELEPYIINAGWRWAFNKRDRVVLAAEFTSIPDEEFEKFKRRISKYKYISKQKLLTQLRYITDRLERLLFYLKEIADRKNKKFSEDDIKLYSLTGDIREVVPFLKKYITIEDYTTVRDAIGAIGMMSEILEDSMVSNEEVKEKKLQIPQWVESFKPEKLYPGINEEWIKDFFGRYSHDKFWDIIKSTKLAVEIMREIASSKSNKDLINQPLNKFKNVSELRKVFESLDTPPLKDITLTLGKSISYFQTLLYLALRYKFESGEDGNVVQPI